ncbi:MAG: hypothetical protein HRU29_15325 [Rhizobiales bacterium]|nr:hypothetical protein [Hyphomicrobiales bacterium]NRB15767.1 hypothetical protein [Hyphomicrobiales bacterium]
MAKHSVTLERIDKALATLAVQIERFPSLDLWPTFDHLEQLRKTYLDRPNRLKAALERVKDTK